MEVDVDSHQTTQWLEEKIYEHNSTRIGKGDGRLFSRVVRDANNEITAGIAGWIWANICEITQLWVAENIRKNGMGEILLKTAEAEAKTNSCHTILVRSFSFQAPHFYERYGYRIEHIVKDFPLGSSYYILLKRIS